MEKKLKYKKKRLLIKKLSICIGLLLCTFFYYKLGTNWLQQKAEVKEFDSMYPYMYQIDSVESQKGKVCFEGWFFKLGESSEDKEYTIVLYDEKNSKKYFLKTEMYKRTEVDNYFSGEYDYSNCGFKASISEKILGDNVYEVLFAVGDSFIATKTNIFYSDNKIWYTNPYLFQNLDVAGTDLENVVEQGMLRVYLPKQGMYIYQYNDKLYWIADRNFNFEEDGTTYIYYRVMPSEKEVMQKNYERTQELWEECSFYFEEMELSGKNTGRYRVAVKDMPQYPITLEWTGYCSDNWDWLNYFIPFYLHIEE